MNVSANTGWNLWITEFSVITKRDNFVYPSYPTVKLAILLQESENKSGLLCSKHNKQADLSTPLSNLLTSVCHVPPTATATVNEPPNEWSNRTDHPTIQPSIQPTTQPSTQPSITSFWRKLHGAMYLSYEYQKQKLYRRKSISMKCNRNTLTSISAS